MSRLVLPVVIVFSFVSQMGFASETQYMDVNLDWFAKNTTRIYSLISEVHVIMEGETEATILKSELSGAVKMATDCEKFDVDNKYTNNVYYYKHEESLGPKDPGYSNWFEGKKLNGKVIKRVIDYCFAN